MSKMSFDEMTKCMYVCDQTIGCSNCGKVWWAENYTDDPTMFHALECELRGRRDIACEWFNVEYIENELGYSIGNDINEYVEEIYKLIKDDPNNKDVATEMMAYKLGT